MKASVYQGPKSLTVVEVPDLPMAADELRIRTLYSGISHGTEMNVYQGYAPFFKKEYDPATRLFVDAKEEKTWQYPIRSCDPGVWYLGYSSVGKVCGERARTYKASKSAISSIRTVLIKARSFARPTRYSVYPPTVNPKHAVVFTNLVTAFNGILDAKSSLVTWLS